MKKYLFAILAIALLAAVWVVSAFIQGRPDSGAAIKNGAAEAGVEESLVDPSDIHVGILSDASSSKAARLLESRLKSLGFKVELVSGAITNLERSKSETSFRLHKSASAKLVTLKRLAFKPALFREERTENQDQEVLVTAWNIDDVRWADMADEALTLVSKDPAEVPVLVMNAGAAVGIAGKLATRLSEQGYTQAEAKNAEGETYAGSALIQYQRNYREQAKRLLSVIKKEGFSEASYRFRADQETPLVVVLGTATSTSPAP